MRTISMPQSTPMPRRSAQAWYGVPDPAPRLRDDAGRDRRCRATWGWSLCLWLSPSPLAGEGARRADEGSGDLGLVGERPLDRLATCRRPIETSCAASRATCAKRRRRPSASSGCSCARDVSPATSSGDRAPLGAYILDFVCFERRLIIEADGSQHAEKAGDEIRDRWLEGQGYRVRRFWNADVLLRPHEVGNTIWADLEGGRFSG